jgi:uracil-DNA glycosylase
VFVLGAYPSALHVMWRPPEGKPVKAMAVDNEPVPFWNGERENEYLANWKRAVGFRDGEWGEVAAVGDLNGSSGVWVDENVLGPLDARREEVCITDVLNTYFSSTGGAVRVRETYAPFANRAGLPAAHLPEHPSEDFIVERGAKLHRERLHRELGATAPDVVVTLGNAALRLVRTIGAASDAPVKLAADSEYGREQSLRIGGQEMLWLPLAHPAAPRVYQEAHARWCRDRRA